MSSCRALSGISNGCANHVGGLDQTFWLFYKSDLNTQVSLRQDKDIDSIDFAVYEGLIRFDGRKFQHQYTNPLVLSSIGNRSYVPTVIVKILSATTETDVILQMLSMSQDIIALVQDNNQEFFILGAGNGLYVTADEQGTGQLGDYDTSDVFTMTGAELTKPLRFSLGTYAQTLQYIIDHETQQGEFITVDSTVITVDDTDITVDETVFI